MLNQLQNDFKVIVYKRVVAYTFHSQLLALLAEQCANPQVFEKPFGASSSSKARANGKRKQRLAFANP